MNIFDELIDPVHGLVTVIDVTVGGNVELEVEATGEVITRNIHYVESFERVEHDCVPMVKALTWTGGVAVVIILVSVGLSCLS